MSQFEINITKCRNGISNLKAIENSLSKFAGQINDVTAAISQLNGYQEVLSVLAKIKADVYTEAANAGKLREALEQAMHHYKEADQEKELNKLLIFIEQLIKKQIELLLNGDDKTIPDTEQNDKSTSDTKQNDESTSDTKQNIDEKENFPSNLQKYYENTWSLLANIKEINTDGKFDYDITNFKKIYAANKEIYEKISAETGVPPELIAALHYRESGCNFNTYLHNGDELGKPTTNYPQGILFNDFTEAAIDALKRELDSKNITMTQDSSMAAMMTFAEIYNGTGYTNNNYTASPYVYSGTNIYTSGKYTSDGHYDPTVVDKQPGIYILINSLMDE